MNPIYCKVSLQELEGREIPWYTGIVTINADATVTLACLPLLLILRTWMYFHHWMCTPVELKLIEEAYRRGTKDGYDAAKKHFKEELDTHVKSTLHSLDELYKIKH